MSKRHDRSYQFGALPRGEQAGGEARTRWVPAQRLGDLFRFRQHGRRDHSARRGGAPGSFAACRRPARARKAHRGVLGDGERPAKGERQLSAGGGCAAAHRGVEPHRGDRRSGGAARPQARLSGAGSAPRDVPPQRRGGLPLYARGGASHAPRGTRRALNGFGGCAVRCIVGASCRRSFKPEGAHAGAGCAALRQTAMPSPQKIPQKFRATRRNRFGSVIRLRGVFFMLIMGRLPQKARNLRLSTAD